MAAAEAGDAAVGALGRLGFEAAEPRFHEHCVAFRYRGRGARGPPGRLPERQGRYVRWRGSCFGRLQYARPRAELGVPRLLGEVEPCQGVGDPPAGTGCWRRAVSARHLLPYFHVYLGPRHGRLYPGPGVV